MSLKSGQVIGAKKIERALNRELNRIEGDIEKGFKVGLDFILEEAKKLTPIDTGALIDSAFTDTDRSSKKIKGRIGYGVDGTISYAPIVHEKPNIVFQRKGAETKFLQKAIFKNIAELIKKIKKAAKR